MLHFYTPWEHQKTSDFLMFSGGTKVELVENELNHKNWHFQFLKLALSNVIAGVYSSTLLQEEKITSQGSDIMDRPPASCSRKTFSMQL